jgi:hypothetical protein
MMRCEVCGETFHEPEYVSGPVEFDEFQGVSGRRETELETCPNCGAESVCLTEIEDEDQDFKRDQLEQVRPLLKDSA